VQGSGGEVRLLPALLEHYGNLAHPEAPSPGYQVVLPPPPSAPRLQVAGPSGVRGEPGKPGEEPVAGGQGGAPLRGRHQGQKVGLGTISVYGKGFRRLLMVKRSP